MGPMGPMVAWLFFASREGVKTHLWLHNFGTGRSSQVTTQLFYNCKKVNCLAFVPLGTHQGFAAVNAAELTHMPRHRIQ